MKPNRSGAQLSLLIKTIIIIINNNNNKKKNTTPPLQLQHRVTTTTTTTTTTTAVNFRSCSHWTPLTSATPTTLQLQSLVLDRVQRLVLWRHAVSGHFRHQDDIEPNSSAPTMKVAIHRRQEEQGPGESPPLKL